MSDARGWFIAPTVIETVNPIRSIEETIDPPTRWEYPYMRAR